MDQQPSSQSKKPDVETDITDVPWNTLVPWTTRLTWQLRLKFFLTGVLFPIICLSLIAILGGHPTVLSSWQSGHAVDYVGVLLAWPALFVFTPLLAYSFICLTRWCLWPIQTNGLLNWMGLLSGAILALTFTILLMITTGVIPLIFALTVAPILALVFYLIDLAIRKKLIRVQFSIVYLIVATTVMAVALALLTAWEITAVEIAGGIEGTFHAWLLSIAGSASTLGFITFCRATRASAVLCQIEESANNNSESIGKRSGVVAAIMLWMGGYLLSWKFAVDLMLVEYAKLPTTQPDCFVSSAAANGHQSFVGSFVLNSSLENEGARINRQMQRLKFFEFAFAAGMPHTHHLTRAIYNRVGPTLAGICRSNVWFSDAAFLVLKPVEWLAIGLSCLAGVSKERVAKIYCD